MTLWNITRDQPRNIDKKKPYDQPQTAVTFWWASLWDKTIRIGYSREKADQKTMKDFAEICVDFVIRPEISVINFS